MLLISHIGRYFIFWKYIFNMFRETKNKINLGFWLWFIHYGMTSAIQKYNARSISSLNSRVWSLLELTCQE